MQCQYSVPVFSANIQCLHAVPVFSASIQCLYAVPAYSASIQCHYAVLVCSFMLSIGFFDIAITVFMLNHFLKVILLQLDDVILLCIAR